MSYQYNLPGAASRCVDLVQLWAEVVIWIGNAFPWWHVCSWIQFLQRLGASRAFVYVWCSQEGLCHGVNGGGARWSCGGGGLLRFWVCVYRDDDGDVCGRLCSLSFESSQQVMHHASHLCCANHLCWASLPRWYSLCWYYSPSYSCCGHLLI